ncbi:MAG: homocysteine S-methyltransferase family protein [Pseudomonadota bacterium]
MTANYAAAVQARLDQGRVVLLDGAIGTELERLGAPMHDSVWCGHALESHPELVAEVHRRYIAAGADVITANTYATGGYALEKAGLANKRTVWNRVAVDLALRARAEHAGDRPVAIAGSVSTFETWDHCVASDLAPHFAEQAETLVDAGVDLLIVEALASPADVVYAAVASSRDRGVPVWAAISCLRARDSDQLMLGSQESEHQEKPPRWFEPYGPVAKRVIAMGADAVLCMHSELTITNQAVQVLRAHHRGPIGAYPNAGYWAKPNWSFIDNVSPEDYLGHAREWLISGATIVGGCCGIGPEHIAMLNDGLAERR